ncbi:MAG: DASS family sodium-coupled anion symporter [Deltaproteobacteria bacterium]|nr:MAG: DASS family sodium-coupled anion symporter [Deltaproteobacteria bacterium]
MERWLRFTPALAVGFALTLFAPSPWEGTGTVRLHGEHAVVEVAVDLDAGGRVPLEGGEIVVGDRLEVRAGPEVREVRLVHRHGDTVVPVSQRSETEIHAAVARPRNATLLLFLLGLVATLWVGEAMPLWATAMLVPVLLVAGGAASPTQALQPFFHPVIALFLAGFALADAVARVGLDHRLALSVVARARTPRTLFGSMLVLSAFLSMFMSNTAAAALLVPLAVSICAPLGEDAAGFRRALVLGIAYAATLGGVGSALGTPANPMAMAFLRDAGQEIGFLGWFAYGLPMVVLFLPVVGGWVWWQLGGHVSESAFAAGRALARGEREGLPPFTPAERRVLGVLGLVVLGWLTDPVHGIHAGVIGLGGVVLLAGLDEMDTHRLKRLDWSALLTFGGGLSLGSALAANGITDWMATRLELLAGLPGIVGVGAVGLCALALTAVASNTASAAILIPVAIPLAAVLDVEPTLLVLVVAVASSIDFALVIGTPPTMVAYSTGEFTASEIFKLGVLLDLLGLAVLMTVVVGLWVVLGLV